MSESNGLPPGWANVKLESFCTVIMGQSPPSSEYNECGEGLPFFQGKAEFTDLFPIARKWCTAPTKIAETDDILLSVRAPVGPTNLAPSSCCIGRGLAAIRPNGAIEHRYVLYAIRAFNTQLAELATGTTFEAVSGDVVRGFTVPLPPLAEQRRIVAAIEQQFTRLDVGVAALRRAQARLKRYRAAVLKAAVEGALTEAWRAANPDTEPADALLARILAERRARWEADQRAKGKDPAKGRYPEPSAPDTAGLPALPVGWRWATVEQLADVGTGATPLRSRYKEYYGSGSIPWVTSGALNESIVTQAEELITERALVETNAKLFPIGTLLLAMYGEGKTRGKVAELRIAAATNQACAALVFRSASESCRQYIKVFMLSNYYEIRRLSAGGVQPNLNLSIVKATTIPLPPIAEQEAIVAEVERRLSVVDALEAALMSNLKRAERLRQSVLREAFAGRLASQDPDDEPASVLLARIRQEREAQAATNGKGTGTARGGARQARLPGLAGEPGQRQRQRRRAAYRV